MWVDATFPRDGAPFFGGTQVQLPLLGLTGTDQLWWDYRLDSTAAFLAGVAYFGAGHLWAEMLRTRASPLPPRRAYALVLAVALLARHPSARERVALDEQGFTHAVLERLQTRVPDGRFTLRERDGHPAIEMRAADGTSGTWFLGNAYQQYNGDPAQPFHVSHAVPARDDQP